MASVASGNGRPALTIRRGGALQWSDRIFVRPLTLQLTERPYTIGVFEGEGIGREVVRAALGILAALQSSTRYGFRVSMATEHLEADAETHPGTALSEGIVRFCHETFSAGGAVLAGPRSGRFVYDIRKRFDLFCKLSPLKPCCELATTGRVKSEYTRGVDVLVVRENISGVYQGQWRDQQTADGGRRVEHVFWYTEAEVRRILRVAACLAGDRRGALMVVVKDGGMPGISNLWRDCAREAAAEAGVTCRFANVDLAAYLLVQQARELDVVVAPNLFGDVLADVGSVLLGSRGLSYSGNFATDGAAIYQTNHGGALDLAGTDRANPVGQIYSLAMLLRESFGLAEAAAMIEAAIAEVWGQGWRTEDLLEPGCRVVGTCEMGMRIADTVDRFARQSDGWAGAARTQV